MKEFYRDLIEEISDKELTKDQILKIKTNLCKKYKIGRIPTDIQILLHAPKNELKKLRSLVTKPIRTMSGVSPIALMTAPFECPHGKCIYCPGGLKSEFGDVPQSYTGMEPSSMRGKRNLYDPYFITFNRLEQYIVAGHLPEKCEVIIQGGTFPSFPKKYQEEYIHFMYKALNDFSSLFFPKGKLNVDFYREFFEMPGEMGNTARIKRIQEKMLKLKEKNIKDLEYEKKKNENSKLRCIALCIETRPDYCFEKEIKQMLKFGTTRIEIGVQALDNKILKKIKRGHTVNDVYKATKLAKNALLKIGYHMMPGLPGVSEKEDLEMFKTLFSDKRLMPDALKIYPTMVMKGTKLYSLWKQGKYKPTTTEKAADLIVKMKKYVPKWCRIMRVQRDIPKQAISAGVNMTNLRQLIEKKMKEKGIKCECIRCREPKAKKIDFENVQLNRIDYSASDGKEIFLSFDDMKNDLLLGFCRLRIFDKKAGIRELHVYGVAAEIGKKGEIQHKGFGKKLIAEAEKIAKKEFRCEKMTIISGVGVREYYYKLGYKQDGVYVSKKIN